MPCRVPKRRFSCGAPQHLTKNPYFLPFPQFAVWMIEAFPYVFREAAYKSLAPRKKAKKEAPTRKQEPPLIKRKPYERAHLS